MSNSDITKLNEFLQAYPDIEMFEVILPDLNGKLRGKWLPRENIEKAFDGGLKLPLTTLGFDVWGRDVESWVYDNGDADGICVPDARTLSVVPWLDRPTGQVLLSLHEVNGDPCLYDARVLLSRLMERCKKLGYTPVVASEMEFHLFQAENDHMGRPKHTGVDANGEVSIGGQTYGIESMQEMYDFLHGVRDACAEQNLPIDTLISEAAPSQYEINLYHQADALLAADQGLLLQRTIKGVASKYGMRATFMAKPFGDMAGNGMHVHCSLLDKDGNNAFNNGTEEGTELLRQAIAGCLATMKDSMLLFAPHLNSYRRFQTGSHAPMAPTWGYDNRTVAVRVPTDSLAAMRVEHRVAGADANLYLAISAIIAGMLYGIENKLQAPPPVEGDAYAQFEPSLPSFWPDAVRAFTKSTFIPEYFSPEFQRAYSEAKLQEVAEFDKHVTDMEYEAYL